MPEISTDSVDKCVRIVGVRQATDHRMLSKGS